MPSQLAGHCDDMSPLPSAVHLDVGQAEQALAVGLVVEDVYEDVRAGGLTA